ncbi:MAG TPA: SPFH domain-containing protein [Bryobacteraceae bacterium]|nr:SPFH domain-containing protein [Bryobacteraceae bacterium]
MLLMKYLLVMMGAGLFAGALGIVMFDIYRTVEAWRQEGAPEAPRPAEIRWREARRWALAGVLPFLLGMSIVVVPSGSAGVLVSQVSGTLPGALYPGVHFVWPLVQSVTLYDTRERVFTTGLTEDAKKKVEMLRVQTKEGLPVGLAIAVRYRLDPHRLDYIHANLPRPIEEEIVPPVVAGVFRQIVPNYLVRDVFATRREEVRKLASDAIQKKLGADGLLVKEVILRDVQLPPEYAKGLETLLLKEQESDRMAVEVEIKQKMVRTAELEAEAERVRRVKQAEGEGQIVVINAKAQADAMQHTLPLKQKQIEQTRLESEARKEATVKNAEALAQAKVIDSRAELERRKLLADAEANRIRVTSAADAERLKTEAAALKQNPLLIQKIIAERLSDKVQVMMVPTDGKFFFANDVLRSAPAAQATSQPAPEDPDDPPAQQAAPIATHRALR